MKRDYRYFDNESRSKLLTTLITIPTLYFSSILLDKGVTYTFAERGKENRSEAIEVRLKEWFDKPNAYKLIRMGEGCGLISLRSEFYNESLQRKLSE